MAPLGKFLARFVEKILSCYLIFPTWHGNEKRTKQKAKYLWLTRFNAKEICNENRDTLDKPAYQEPTVRNKAVVFAWWLLETFGSRDLLLIQLVPIITRLPLK